MRGLKQQEILISQSWRPEVWNWSVFSGGFLRDSEGRSIRCPFQLLVFVSCPQHCLACRHILPISASAFPWPYFLRVSVSKCPPCLLTGMPITGLGAHPKSKMISSPDPYWIWRPYFFPFLIKLLGWHWSTGSHRLQVYMSMIQDLHSVLCTYHPESSHPLPPYGMPPPPPPPSLWQPPHCYVHKCQFSIPHISEIIWFLTFSDISFSVIFSRSIHVVTNGSISSFLMA